MFDERVVGVRARTILAVVLAVLAVVGSLAGGVSPAAAAGRESETDSIDRLYRAALLRPPDAAGAAYWSERHLTCASALPRIADALLGSAEGVAVYGGLPNRGFVDALYHDTLGRPGDAAGVDHWTGALDAGTLTRGQVLVAFSESPEFVALTGTQGPLPPLCASLSVSDSVYRLYRSAFGRAPDVIGERYWIDGYARCRRSLPEIAAAFVGSPEFAQRYGSVGGRELVERLYRNVLGRPADPAGVDFWATALESGRLDLASVLIGLSESPEHVAVTGTMPPVAPACGSAALTGGRFTVALTFDDGPSAWTASVLDVLDREGVPGTFFVVGRYVADRAAVVARAAASGHGVHNHSWSHPVLTTLSNAGIGSELRSTSDVVEAVTGLRPRCLRPPYGATNDRVRSVATSVGLREVLWNVDPSDYLNPSPATIAARVLAQADGRSLVVGLHDGGGTRANTVAALPAIIGGLRARGYEFVTACP
jgi:peptidoglycan/xylan/chitin deacetylase (PgdA/CDA1 family)